MKMGDLYKNFDAHTLLQTQFTDQYSLYQKNSGSDVTGS